MSKMKTKRPRNRFWLLLGTLNVFAMLYPISLFVRVESGDAHFFVQLS